MTMLCLTQVASAADLSTEKKAIPILMMMFEKEVVLLLRNSEGKKHSAPMTKQQLADTVKWLKSLRFNEFSNPIKQDFEAYRQQLLTTCTDPPTVDDGYGHGKAWAELGLKFLTLMVDFDLDKAKARRYGYAKLAPRVDEEALILGHVMLTVQAKLNVDEFKRMKPATRVFIDLFTIFNFLAGTEGRNIMLQGSIYCIHPEEIKDNKQRKVLVDAKENIIGLSHCRSKKDEKRLYYTAMSINYLCDAYKVCQIADADLKKAGGEALYKQVHGMIKLREGKAN
jgi:hypothetical protein